MSKKFLLGLSYSKPLSYEICPNKKDSPRVRAAFLSGGKTGLQVCKPGGNFYFN
jgi:hypothetical protein